MCMFICTDGSGFPLYTLVCTLWSYISDSTKIRSPVLYSQGLQRSCFRTRHVHSSTANRNVWCFFTFKFMVGGITMPFCSRAHTNIVLLHRHICVQFNLHHWVNEKICQFITYAGGLSLSCVISWRLCSLLADIIPCLLLHTYSVCFCHLDGLTQEAQVRC